MKIFDFQCSNLDCPLHELVIEEFVEDVNETTHCSHCRAPRTRLLGNPAGRVMGSTTPCPKR